MMCTIMTFDYNTYQSNHSAIERQIRDDALFNCDGWSLLMVGGDSTLIKSLSLELIITVLRTTQFQRFWLHSRAATTRARGLVHTHGFAGGDWLVFHNGILTSDESRGYPVDSQLIADRVAELGVLPGLQSLSHERYLNAFTVNTNTGQWYVSRHFTNSLYNDGGSNYSTNAISAAGCTELVRDNTITVHQENVSYTEQFDDELASIKYCDMAWD